MPKKSDKTAFSIMLQLESAYDTIELSTLMLQFIQEKCLMSQFEEFIHAQSEEEHDLSSN